MKVKNIIRDWLHYIFIPYCQFQHCLMILRKVFFYWLGTHITIIMSICFCQPQNSDYNYRMQVEPCMWDSGWLSSYYCPRLYWGNLPELYTAVQYYTSHTEDVFNLDSCLLSSLNRVAKVTIDAVMLHSFFAIQ